MQKLKQGFKKIPLILLFILALVVVFSLKTKQYLTYRNLLVLLQQGSVLLIVASSATFIIISGGLDLSLGAILTLSGITAALAVTAGTDSGRICGGCADRCGLRTSQRLAHLVLRASAIYHNAWYAGHFLWDSACADEQGGHRYL